MVDIDNFKLDFLGVVNLFGGDVALAAVHYCVVERTFFDLLWTFYLSPGMYVIALKILKRTENPLAMALSPGDRDECREVVGLMESGNFTYAGLLSGTCAKVSNLIGEAVLNISKGKVEVKGPMEGKKAKRETNVNVIKVDYKPEKNAERIKAIKKDRIFIILDILPPLLTLGASAYLIWANKIFAAIIVILGAFSNLSLTWATCAEGCKYMSGEPSDKSPPGHCIVKDDSSPNQIWVVLGNELSIQYLLQRPIIVELNQFWILMNLITGVFAYAYTIFTILVLPSIDTFEQLIMAALLIIGFLANIMYAKRDGVKLLSKIAERDMKVEYKEGIKFTNRASAVAYCVLRCKGTNGYTSDFLPDIDVWKSWKEFLAYLSRNQDIYLSDESQENFDLMNLAKEWQNNISRNEIKKEDEDLWKYLIAGINEAFYWIRKLEDHPHVVIGEKISEQ